MPGAIRTAALPPAEFVKTAQAKGFVFSVKPGGALGVKPPAPDAMTPSVRRYVSAMKRELLELLTPTGCRTTPQNATRTQLKDSVSESSVKAQSIGADSVPTFSNPAPNLEEVGRVSPHQAEVSAEVRTSGELYQLQQVATKSASELVEVGWESPHPLDQVGAVFEQNRTEFLYQDKRQEVLSWALSEARCSLLPELSEPLTLPSGQRVQAGGAAAWLLTRHEVALRLALVSTGDAPAALEVLRNDLRALALWAAHARVWLDAPYKYQGAFCLLPGFVVELEPLDDTHEHSIPHEAIMTP